MSRPSDDDDDRPRRSYRREDDPPPKAKGGGALPVILVLVGGAVLFLLLGVGAVVVMLPSLTENPKVAFNEIQQAAGQRDWSKVYDRMDDGSRTQFDSQVANTLQWEPRLAAHKQKKGRELFVAVMGEADKPGGDQVVPSGFRWAQGGARLESVYQSGAEVNLSIRTGDGRYDSIKMAKQDGKWRVSSGGSMYR